MNTAIILAAGRGTRMKSEMNKQYLVLKGKPIIVHTLRVFQDSPFIDEIILVVNKNEREICQTKILDKYQYSKITKVIHGGDERQKSVLNGLMEIEENTEIVLIHDGARPLVTQDMIQRCVEGAKIFGAVSVGVPIKETIKIMTKDKFVSYTPIREDVWITQTPQAFKIDIIKNAHELAIEREIFGTDDAMLVEHMGHKVKMVEGDYENLKITTPEDLITAEAILNYKRKR